MSKSPYPTTTPDKIAFPATYDVDIQGEWHTLKAKGMTLREYYAGQALAGLCADPTMGPVEKSIPWCVECADALIAELAKDKEATS